MKLFLIDGHALVFKMYYAFLGRPMVNSKGEDTSILFGFTKYLLELIEREAPTHIAVSFDPPGGTFRNVMYPEYKANRAETPQLVIEALEPLTEIVRALGIPVLTVKGFEADDVIGSMAKRCAAEGLDVYMVTPDKDYGQLVGPHIFQYRPGKAGGENEILAESDICAKWGIDSTSQVIDILAICGDTADNVPGVQGVGPVGASKLLAKYGSVDGIYAHLDELTASGRAKFEAASDHIGLSRQLVTIKTDIPLDTTVKDMEFNTVITPGLLAIFDRYEMPSLKRMLSRMSLPAAAVEAAPRVDSRKPEFSLVSPGELTALARRDGEVAVNVIVKDGRAVDMYAATGTAVANGLPSRFADLLGDASVIKAGAGLKAQINALAAEGLVLEGRLKDIELMHYLLNPERSHSVETLAGEYLGLSLESDIPDGETSLSLFDETPEESGPDRNLETVAIRYLADRLSGEIEADAATSRLYNGMEEPLVRVLARMEQAGVRIDLASLREFAEGLRSDMLEREAQVREFAGDPALNVSSPKQIGELVFEKLKLDPGAKKPKSGNWPTDEQTLTELSEKSPVIDAILDYRGLRKLLSTYIEPFPGYVSPVDGRVHTTFNQTLTSTGRLSSSNPNLQNIPIRTEQGREIRRAFVPGAGGMVMMSADYSQIELRIMAHLCGDEHLCEAFRNGTDVHSATASKIFRVPVGEVSAEMRRVAKTANFGILYGISAFGLSQRLKCSRSEAKRIIDDYFESFPKISGFISETLADARAKGYVETIFGRRRYVPDLNSSNGNLRAFAERNAVNAPIQGSSADIIKLAMVGVDSSLQAAGLKARMVLQVHDELVLEVPENEIDTVRDILVREMEGVVKLNVPLTVECNYGKTWLEAH